MNIKLSPEQMSECLESAGIAFLFAQTAHPAMRHAAPVRKELGVRTVFNILGPLTNPAGVKRYVLGVYSKELAKLMANAALELKFERVFAVCGHGGLDEFSVSGPSYVTELKDGKLSEYELDPSEFNIPLSPLDSIRGGSPAENAVIIRQIFEGSLSGPKRDIIILNAAAALLAADVCESWADAISAAARSIDSGAAMKKVRQLADFTNKL